MNLGELAVLRRKLREVNIEYSALVRKKAVQARFVRLEELRVERYALMALIADERGRDGSERRLLPAQESANSVRRDAGESLPL
jgi:hypothetical protein